MRRLLMRPRIGPVGDQGIGNKWHPYSCSGAELGGRRARVQIAVATLSGNSLGQTVHTHRASVHQGAKFVAALLTVAKVTAGGKPGEK